MSHQGYQPLSTKDVVFVEGLENSAALFKADSTLRVKDLLTKIEAICAASGQLSTEEVSMLFGAGINCEILRPGATDWAQGKLQLNLGFQSRHATLEVPIPTPAAKPMTNDRSETIAPSPKPIEKVITAPTPPAKTAMEPVQLATAIEADDSLELDIANFTNATDRNDDFNQVANIDRSDVFSLMDENQDETPLEEDFSFGQVLESLGGLEFDVEPASKSINSPWDLEELDSMLMVK